MKNQSLERRNFILSSFTGLSALIAGLPALPAAQLPTVSSAPAIINPEVAAKIAAYESVIAANPAIFNWSAHNELRHLYLAVDENLAMKHADIIFQHSLMDSYILNTLSDWFIEKDPALAVVRLVHRADKFGYFKSLRGACLVKAGDIVRLHGPKDLASRLYQKVIEQGSFLVTSDAAKQYHHIAQLRLVM
jgi:hypothetical protein